MTFVQPLWMLFGLTVLPITAFYLLRVRPRRVPVSTLLFWDQVFAERRPRTLWRRLRHPLSWLAQVVMALGLAFLLGGPRFAWEEREARTLVVVLDDGASLQAGATPGARFAAAKARVREIVDGLAPGDRLAIVTTANGPRVAVRFGDHRTTLLDGLEGIVGSHAPSQVTEAVAFAEAMLHGSSGARLIVVSDGCFPGAAALAARSDVACVDVGGAEENTAITAFQVRRSAADALGFEVLVEVVHYGSRPTIRDLTLELEGRIVDAVRLELAPEVPWRRVSKHAGGRGGRLVARLGSVDALALDDVAFARLPDRERWTVSIVSQDPLFLPAALSAHALVAWTARAFPYAPQEPDEIVIYHRDVPEVLPPGRLLVVDPRRDTDLFRVGEVLPDVLVGRVDGESPWMRHVHLENVLLSACRRLEPTSGARVHAADLLGHPLVLSFERAIGPVAVLALNTEEGDLPLRTSFPLLLANALWNLGGVDAVLQPSLATGDVHVGAVVAGEEELRDPGVALDPDGQTRPIVVDDGRRRLGPLDRIGFWSIPGGAGEVDVEVACQLTRPSESDLRAPQAWRAAAARTGDFVRRAGVPASRLLLWIVFAALVGEWFLHQRRHLA